MNIDLTEGRIGKKLLLYFIPIAAGTLFQQLYNAVDAIIVGKFVGTVALAAVGGSSTVITNLLIGFFVALSGGCSVIIAQIVGAKNDMALRRSTGTAVAFCLIAGAALSVTGFAFTPAMLRILRTPADTMASSVTYLRYIFVGVTAQLLYNIEAGILRAVGDSRSPFIYLFVCCMANIVMDLVFVCVFNMGVTGAALATILSQLLSAVLAGIKLSRSREAYRLSLKTLCLDRIMLRQMLHIGVPAGLQNAMYNLSNLIIQVAVNSLGTAVVAGWALSNKIDGFYWACANAAGIAVMNFAAQNYGAGRMDRVKDGLKLGLKAFMVVTVCFSVVLMALGRTLLPVFTDDMAVVDATWHIMLYIVPYYFTWTFIEIISGTLRGIGDAVAPVVICALGICVLRLVWLAVGFSLYPTLFTLCLNYPISWAVTDIAFVIYWFKGKWQNKLPKIQSL